MSRTRPDHVLDAGIDHESLHKPILIPGFAAYCPVCGTGWESAEIATACCASVVESSRRRMRTGHERR